MLFALPALSRPDLDLPSLIALATAHDLDIELHASRDATQAVGTNLLFTDAAKTRRVLTDAGVTLATVWATVPAAIDPIVGDELKRMVEAVAVAGGSIVRLIESRPTPAAVLHAAGIVADNANVRLTLDTPPIRAGVLEVWRRLDAVNHPSVGCCLDTHHLAATGDGPSLAIPTLARRLMHARLTNPSTDADTVHRLAGIGYAGWLSIDAVDAMPTLQALLPKRPV